MKTTTTASAIALSLLMAGSVHAAFALDFDTDSAGSPILPGQIIDTEYADFGIHIEAENLASQHPDLAAAFNSASPTGGDSDLYTAGYNNILIIAERGDDDGNGMLDAPPDDEGRRPAGWVAFTLDFTGHGLDITFVDTEEAGSVDFFFNGVIVDTMAVPSIANGAIQSLSYAEENFDAFIVNLGGSGAIAEAVVNVPAPGALVAMLAAGAASRRRRRRRN